MTKPKTMKTAPITTEPRDLSHGGWYYINPAEAAVDIVKENRRGRTAVTTRLTVVELRQMLSELARVSPPEAPQ